MLAPSPPGDLARVGAVSGAMVAKAGKRADPLNVEQRHALRCLEHLGDGEGLVAVTGPPGTGKTAMLRAMIATRWSKAAVVPAEGGAVPACPVSLACGATNQSVENVLGTFDGVHDEGRPIARRWIRIGSQPAVDRYCASVPSRARLSAHEAAGYAIIDRHSPEKGGRFSYAGAAALLSQTLMAKTSAKRRVGLASDWVGQFGRLVGPGCSLGLLARFMPSDATACAQAARKHLALLVEKDADGGGPTITERTVAEAAGILLRSARLLSRCLADAMAGQGELLVEIEECLRLGTLAVWLERSGVDAGAAADACKMASRPVALPPEELAEAVLDVCGRPDVFHLAARVWEARWILARLGKPVSSADAGRDRIGHLRQAAMLFPCLVSTLHSAPALVTQQGKLRLGEIDLLIVDEAGQAGPDLGAAAFALARQAVVVGDVKQLAPVSQVPRPVDDRIAEDGWGSGAMLGWRARGADVSTGSIMRLAMTASGYGDPGRDGILLRRHYRCARSIIEYCIDLIYHEPERDESGRITRHELAPQVEDPLPGSLCDAEDPKADAGRFRGRFPLPPLAFFQSGSASDEPARTGTWSNPGEADAIVAWLERNGRALTRWIARAEGACGMVDLADTVGIVTPFRGQADLIAGLVKERLDGADPWRREGARPLSQRMVIGTVHKLQGAERPVILFSGVNKEAEATTTSDGARAKVFLDRDGGNLLNVAVSRAQKSFILFGHADLFFSPRALAGGNDLPTALLGRRMACLPPDHPDLGLKGTGGVRIGPAALVAVESPHKARAIQEYLGPLDHQLFATEGHVRELAGWGVIKEREGFRPIWRLAVRPGDDNPKRAADPGEVAGVLTRVGSRLLQTRTLVLATDADAQGEAIAWHLLQILKTHPWWPHVEEVARVRFSEISGPAIRRAFASPDRVAKLRAGDLPEDALNMGLVCGAVAQAVFDNHLGRVYAERNVPGGGRVKGPLLRLLNGDLERKPGEPDPMSVEIRLHCQGTDAPARLVSNVGGNWETWRTTARSDALSAIASLPCRVGSEPLAGWSAQLRVPGPDRFGTITALVHAAERHGMKPGDVMAALQELYEHRPEGDRTGSTVRAGLPAAAGTRWAEMAGRWLELTPAGIEQAEAISRDPVLRRLATLETTRLVEADLDEAGAAAMAGPDFYKHLLSRWLRELAGHPCSPGDLAGMDQTGDLAGLFLETCGGYRPGPEGWSIPDGRQTPGDAAALAVSTRPVGAASPHAALAPLNLDISSGDRVMEARSAGARDVYGILRGRVLASVVADVGLHVETLVLPVIGLPTGVAVAVSLARVTDEGWLRVDPGGRGELLADYAAETVRAALLSGRALAVARSGTPRVASLGQQTLGRVLRFMSDNGLGRPSTFARHVTTLLKGRGSSGT